MSLRRRSCTVPPQVGQIASAGASALASNGFPSGDCANFMPASFLALENNDQINKHMRRSP
jgi:hypothetical protein